MVRDPNSWLLVVLRGVLGRLLLVEGLALRVLLLRERRLRRALCVRLLVGLAVGLLRCALRVRVLPRLDIGLLVVAGL